MLQNNPVHTGWIRASEHKFAATRVFMSSDYSLRRVRDATMGLYPLRLSGIWLKAEKR